VLKVWRPLQNVNDWLKVWRARTLDDVDGDRPVCSCTATEGNDSELQGKQAATKRRWHALSWMHASKQGGSWRRKLPDSGAWR